MTRRRVKEMSEDEKKEEGRRVYQLMAYNMAVDVIDGKIDRCPVAVGNLHSSLTRKMKAKEYMPRNQWKGLELLVSMVLGER